MAEMDVTLYRAMERSHDTWSVHTTHTEDEQAFADRTLMAAEIIRLTTELAETLTALTEAEQEVETLQDIIRTTDHE